jgi:AcrR family transcriptional regulator
MAQRATSAQRRHQIAEAVWRLAGRGGLESVTLRQVAAEADVPVRLLQYHFGTRQQLLVGALQILNTEAEQQAQTRLAALANPTTRDLVRGIVMELLPLDEERRSRHLIYAAYFNKLLTDPELQPFARDAEPDLANVIAGLIQQGQQDGSVPAAMDPGLEAALLIAIAEGLQGQVLLGQISPADAVSLIDHQLDRVVPTAGNP